MSTNLLNLVSEEIFADKLDTLNTLLAAIASGNGGIKITKPEDLQALVDLNLHRKIPVGEQFSFERETAIVASIGNSTGITAAAVDEDVFVAAEGEAHEGVCEFTYDGAAWHKEDGTPILLADYGITVTGTPAEGDHVVVTETASTIVFELMDYDKDCAEDEHSLVFLSKDLVAYGTIPFSAPQLMVYAKVTLPAGKYRFTLDHGAYGGSTASDGTYIFETASDIPAGGGIRHSFIGSYSADGYNKAQVTGGTISTYGVQPARAAIQTNIAVREWDGTEVAVDLGTLTARDAQYFVGRDTETVTLNFTERQYGGDNNYSRSAYIQWLNSDAKAVPSSDTTTVSNWWTPQSVFDMPPSGAKLAGFLHGLDPALRKIMGEATVVTATPDPDRTLGEPNSYVTKTKVFMPSMSEIYGGNNIGVAEGSQYEFFKGTDNAAKIKRYSGTARFWFERSAYPGFGSSVRLSSSSGALNRVDARYADGLPAAWIIKSKIRQITT